MIFARTLKAAAAAAIVACSAGVAVVASAFALYALLRLALNPAASAAIVGIRHEDPTYRGRILGAMLPPSIF